jgi:hypothetical protein
MMDEVRLPDWLELGEADTELWPAPLDDEGPRVMPLTWDRGPDRLWGTYERAERDHYSLAEEINWSLLNPDDHSPEERLGLAYWFAMHGSFESAGVLTFARALIAAFEAREHDAVRRMLVTVTRDENHHDEMAMRVCRVMAPGFPDSLKPSTELEWAAMRNMAWVQSRINHYWRGYLTAHGRYRFGTIVSAFAAGEAAGTFMFGQLGQDSTHPVLRDLMRLVARDESRHFSLAAHLMRRYLPIISEDEQTAVLKNLVGSYAYFSVFMDEPNELFWGHLPDGWLDWHRRLEDHARGTGLAVPDSESRRALWRAAFLRVKSIVDEVGLEFPAIPELGIDGQTLSITPEDVLVAAL